MGIHLWDCRNLAETQYKRGGGCINNSYVIIHFQETMVMTVITIYYGKTDFITHFNESELKLYLQAIFQPVYIMEHACSRGVDMWGGGG